MELRHGQDEGQHYSHKADADYLVLFIILGGECNAGTPKQCLYVSLQQLPVSNNNIGFRIGSKERGVTGEEVF